MLLVCYDCGLEYEPGHTYYCSECRSKRRREAPEETEQRKAELKEQKQKVRKVHDYSTRVTETSKYGAKDAARWSTKVQNWKKLGIVNPPETHEEYDDMVADLNGICPACGRPPNGGRGNGWALHHNYNTGLVVGIVCSRCNMGMGQFEDNPDLLMHVASWMIQFEDNTNYLT